MGVSESVRETLTWLWEKRPCDEGEVEIQARLLFLDTLGCMIAGMAKPEVRALHEQFAVLEPGSVSLLASAQHQYGPVGTSAAATLSGVAACWDEACEGLARAHGRPGLHAFAGTYPVAMATGATLGETLDALVAGFELGGRLGEALRIYPGMHVDGTWGTFAATASVARVLGLDVSATQAAIEGAACQIPLSLYLPVPAGATVRNLYVGLAGARALYQVLAVRSGISSPANALGSLERAFEPPTVWTDSGLWLITEGYLKPYAAVRHVHYGTQAACEWHAAHGTEERIVAVRLETYPEALTYCGNRKPASPIQAQFSLSFGVAHGLLYGDLGPEAYGAEKLGDPELARVEGLVEVRSDASFGSRRGARLHVEGESGQISDYIVDSVPGDLECPLSGDEVQAKFIRYVAPVLGEQEADRLSTRLLTSDTEVPLAEVLIPGS